MDNEKWSKDWENYDWSYFNNNIDKIVGLSEDEAAKVIGLTKSDVEEYCEWLKINNPKELEKMMIYRKLRDNDFPNEHAEYIAEHPDVLLDIFRILGIE